MMLIRSFFLKNTFQNNFSFLIEDNSIRGCKVLDVGCSPGTWLLELSNTYTSSQFIGLDMKPIYPQQEGNKIRWIYGSSRTIHYTVPDEAGPIFKNYMEERSRIFY
ncbi:hypothetical protein RhiirC2_869403 [Rhizophagus irregularis]|uniref:Methyltransferase domain-containing protein n=1 Tax=Rhizophagus irregularis TaxID=588596 RepID=A0A2N1MRF1_9GLOM|nr:hypothetical protein RhiirC2_869403 [Rhizophagus irregularis]